MKLFCDLADPKCAREYVKGFRFSDGKKPEMLRFSSGEEIEFTNMTDDEAVKVAHALCEMEIEAQLRLVELHGLPN